MPPRGWLIIVCHPALVCYFALGQFAALFAYVVSRRDVDHGILIVAAVAVAGLAFRPKQCLGLAFFLVAFV